MSEESEKKFALSCEFSDIIQLYRAYMPFVEGGGIFIPTNDETIELGDKIVATVKLPEGDNAVTITGKVVWFSPKKLLSEETKAGVGVRIEGENAKEVRSQIEDLIKDYLNSGQPTDTM